MNKREVLSQASEDPLCAAGLRCKGFETSSICHFQKMRHRSHLIPKDHPFIKLLPQTTMARRKGSTWIGFFTRGMFLLRIVSTGVPSCDFSRLLGPNQLSSNAYERIQQVHAPCGADMHHMALKCSSRLAKRNKFSTATWAEAPR